MEVWKDVLGYDGLYKISNLGNVKSFKCGKQRIIKGGIDTCGYRYVSLSRKNISVHRLVAIAFISNPENKPCVNHINGIKTDNRIDNLEWVTVKENTIHSYKIGLQRGKSLGTNVHAKKVINIDTNEVYCCIKSACEITPYKYTTFVAMLNGRSKNKSRFTYL